jgi:hypothetical protein
MACAAVDVQADVDTASPPPLALDARPDVARDATVATSAPRPQDDPSTEEGWGFLIKPYLFASGLDGDVGTGDATEDIEASFDDLLDDLNFGAMLQLEVVPPESPWRVLVDLWFVQLEETGVAPGPMETEVDAEIDQFMGELSVAYELMDDGRLDVLGGIRYWDLSSELEGGDSSAEGEVDWIDPLVGARSLLPLGERFFVLLRGDVGGFGVGSDISYNLGAGVGWSISKTFELAAGYRYVYVDYDDDVVYDVAQSGPLLGLVIRL